MTIPASVTKHKNLLGIGAAVFSVGLFGAAAFAVYENQTTAAPAPATADAPAVTPEPSAAPSDQPAQGRDMLKSVARDALRTAARYLGLPPKEAKAETEKAAVTGGSSGGGNCIGVERGMSAVDVDKKAGKPDETRNDEETRGRRPVEEKYWMGHRQSENGYDDQPGRPKVRGSIHPN